MGAEISWEKWALGRQGVAKGKICKNNWLKNLIKNHPPPVRLYRTGHFWDKT